MWLRPKAYFLALSVLGVVAACAQTEASKGGSGETHFLLSCEASCAGGLECLCGVCSRTCDEDAACSGLGSAATCVEHTANECTTVTNSCDVTCRTNSDCYSVSAEHTCQTGRCRMPGSGSVGGGGAGGAPPDNASGAGAGGSAGASIVTPPQACGDGCGDSYASCAVSVPGCDLAATCLAVSGCGTTSVDEGGCFRPECESDDDCASGARCTLIHWQENMGDCSPDGDPCDCPRPTPLKACSPTALAGPRGKWSTLTIEETGVDGVVEKVFTPDGAVEISEVEYPSGSSSTRKAQLDETDSTHLTELIDRHELRLLLASSEACEPLVDFDFAVQLELDTMPLTKELAGCLDTNHVVAELRDLAVKY